MSAAPRTSRILGRSPAIRGALEAARLAARMSGPVLILGERGTGKELFARFIHDNSRRKSGPMVTVNCASLSPELADAQLFGHERGAFTGAVRTNCGYVGAAEGGTLMLDEVGELPLEVQARLLRLLQEGKVVSVGDTKERRVTVKIVAATNRDLGAMARVGAFREDLLDRLRVWELRLPPLRERKADLLELAKGVLAREPDLAGRRLSLGRGALAALKGHDWPGNVRELQRVLLRAASRVKDGEAIGARHLRAELAEAGASQGVSVEARILAALDAGAPIAMGTLVSRTGLARSTLKAALARLLAVGALGRTGAGPGTRYTRASGPETASPAAETVDPLGRRALEVLGDGVARGCGAVAAALDVSPSTALRALSALMDAGLVTRAGRGRACSYTLSRREPRAPSPPPVPPAPPPLPVERARTPLEQLALDLARRPIAVARRELVVASGLSPRTVLRALRRLTAEGALVEVGGRGCGARYGLPGAPPPPKGAATRPAGRPKGGSEHPVAPGLARVLVASAQRGLVRVVPEVSREAVDLQELRRALADLAARGLLVPIEGGYALAPTGPPSGPS